MTPLPPNATAIQHAAIDTMALATAISVAGGMTLKEIGAYIKTHHLFTSRRWIAYLLYFFETSFTYNPITKKYNINLLVLP
jgi:hypothetical protein